MTTDPIRVLLAGDHLLVRRGLATLLLAFNDMVVVGEAQNSAEALECCATTHPNVILMDLVMPEMDSVQAIRTIRERYPHIQVLVLTNWLEYELLQRALAAGAEGYLLQNVSAGDLADALWAARTGRPQRLPQTVEIRAHSAQTHAATLRQCEELTEREHEVLALMTHGLTNPQIGQELIISRATVKFHVSSILSKLGVGSRTEAVALAVQTHLTNGPDPNSHHQPEQPDPYREALPRTAPAPLVRVTT
jgi:DNA-binding NarL/FixJ family response regulator